MTLYKIKQVKCGYQLKRFLFYLFIYFWMGTQREIMAGSVPFSLKAPVHSIYSI